MKRLLAAVAFLWSSISGFSQSTILINNVQVFNGKDEKLFLGNVLIKGDSIVSITDKPVPVDKSGRTTIIDGKGKYLIPGLIDAHWHATMAAIPMLTLLTADIGYINLVAGEEAKKTLLRGFTTIRDLAGPSFGLKRAIDEGLIQGPRIYPSGAMISQSGGHGDFRFPYEVPAPDNAPLSHGEVMGGGVIADDPASVRKRAREQLMLGATQLKLAAGGGVSSAYDPIDVTQYTVEEFHAAVEAAENWGTYVTVHAYTPRAIQMAIKGGVKCIDHGQMMDEETAKLIADKGVWLCLQAFLDNEYSNEKTSPAMRTKQLTMYQGTDNAYRLAKKYKIKLAWGTDILFNPAAPKNQGAILTTLTQWFTPYEILKMATSTNGELMALCGPRNPYPRKLGVLQPGAYADMILVEGNPLQDIKLVADPEKNFSVIIKNGVIVKNSLQP
ncbi:metal-dependent hydrolase family protein [Flavihumibacter petaseus]|uniref:Peptidase M38 family protein n=1 Tax=Flavihumibacter petaseus NBRC 106054 TaxID=1220578 RepID=A0A0E9N8F5_9BACT|nr:amidohydrolase family protein [Flavihumibacter petaseus]GAO45675.1 peptidase M38 family protein [Flavihumibacter petaseus NBRC 106054]